VRVCPDSSGELVMVWFQAGRRSGRRPHLSNVVEIVWVLDVPQLTQSRIDVEPAVAELDFGQMMRSIVPFIQPAVDFVEHVSHDVELAFVQAEHCIPSPARPKLEVEPVRSRIRLPVAQGGEDADAEPVLAEDLLRLSVDESVPKQIEGRLKDIVK
jgi:hypothetical protein